MKIRAHYPRIGEITAESDPVFATVTVHGIGQGADGERTLADVKRALATELHRMAAELEIEATNHDTKSKER